MYHCPDHPPSLSPSVLALQMTDNTTSKVIRRTDSSSKTEAVCDDEDRCSVGCFTVPTRSCQVVVI